MHLRDDSVKRHVPGLDGLRGQIQRHVEHRDPSAQRSKLDRARIRQRCGNLGEAHRSQLSPAEAICADFGGTSPPAGDRLRHQAESIDPHELGVRDLLEPVLIRPRTLSETAPDVSELVERDLTRVLWRDRLAQVVDREQQDPLRTVRRMLVDGLAPTGDQVDHDVGR